MPARPSPYVHHQLRLAIFGPYGDADRNEEDFDTLLWRVGRMRDEIEHAHHWLDMQGAPREQGGEVLTLRGRMDAMDYAAERRVS